MIAIINKGPHNNPNPFGECEYEVRINDEVICAFKHCRSNGLARCLLEASKAVANKQWGEHALSRMGEGSAPRPQTTVTPVPQHLIDAMREAYGTSRQPAVQGTHSTPRNENPPPPPPPEGNVPGT